MLARLSDSVLLTGAAIAPGGDSETTARLLYHGNWLPLTPAWLARFGEDGSAVRYVAGDAAVDGSLAGRWLRSADASWIHWSAGRRGPASGRYKVYISVVPEEMPETFERCVGAFLNQRTQSFKLARQARAMLRPDRFVAYCATRAETDELIAELASALDGATAHGVPFTAEAAAPTLSWARDPRGAVASYAPSWRSWVTRKLAAYLHASDAADPAGRAAFARARLAEEGVDTERWAPGDTLWR